MLTGAQYKESLNDGRHTYFEGERIDDLVGHPILGQTADVTAASYDKYYDPAPEAVSPLLAVPGSADDLRALIPLLHDAGMMAHVTSTSIQTLKTAAGRMADVKPDYIERIGAYMHAIRDLTADAYGGWKFVTNLQAGGGLYAQRIVTRRHYDLDGAKRKALSVAGLTEDDAH
jgi:aromatic ring hydroxylase